MPQPRHFDHLVWIFSPRVWPFDRHLGQDKSQEKEAFVSYLLQTPSWRHHLHATNICTYIYTYIYIYAEKAVHFSSAHNVTHKYMSSPPSSRRRTRLRGRFARRVNLILTGGYTIHTDESSLGAFLPLPSHGEAWAGAVKVIQRGEVGSGRMVS